MEGRVKLLGHPLHQMLIVLPLGLLVGAIAFDVVALVGRNGFWSEMASWLIAAGLIGALLAAPFGLIALSFAGGALAAVTGWLGGELVDRMGVGVDDGAHLDAPSSLSGRPAREGIRAATHS